MSTLSPTEALWAHVLRKDKAQPRDHDVPQVPVAPVDRNATSTRILLYDTQARLEQFSSRADAMLKGMQDANHQLKTVGMLFEKDRDTLTNDIIDLVNRSQREIQKAVGQPAQEPQSLAFQEKLELRVQGLNQRLDALQMFNQTHCQALETHSQILKSMQDQQTALLSTLLPLLPLVQAFPPQLDQIQASIREVNESLVSAVAKLKRDLTAQLHSTSRSRKRRPSKSSPSHSIKRPRIESLGSPSSTSTKSDEKISHPTSVQSATPLRFRSPVLARTTPVIPRIQRSVFATPRPKATTPFSAATAVLSQDNSRKRLPSLLQRMTSPSQKAAPCVPHPVLQDPPIPKAISSTFSRTPSKSWLPTFEEPRIQLSNVKTVRPQMSNENTFENTLPAGSRELTLVSASVSTLPVQPRTSAGFPPEHEGNSTLNLRAGLTLHPTPSCAFRNQVKESARDGRRFIPLDDDDDDDDDT